MVLKSVYYRLGKLFLCNRTLHATRIGYGFILDGDGNSLRRTILKEPPVNVPQGDVVVNGNVYFRTGMNENSILDL